MERYEKYKDSRRWSDRGLLNWLKMSFYKICKPKLSSLQWRNAPGQVAKTRLRSVEATYLWSAAITETRNKLKH